MTREEKANIIEELSEKFNSNNNYYFCDASGLTVAEINDFRRLCFNEGVEYKVYKNTLITKALEKLDNDYSELNDTVLKGTTGIMFSAEVANTPAKVIKKYRKTSPEGKPYFKGACVDSDIYIGEEHLNGLSELKSKNELIGEIIGLLQSPAKNVISALQSGENKLSGVIKTLADREEQ